MIRIFFAFHEERQKVSSLFEGGNGANREQHINFRIGREWKVNLHFPALGRDWVFSLPSGKGETQKKIPKILLILSKKLKRVNIAPCRGLPHTTSSTGGRWLTGNLTSNIVESFLVWGKAWRAGPSAIADSCPVSNERVYWETQMILLWHGNQA